MLHLLQVNKRNDNVSLTTRWNGPGIRRQKQEIIQLRVHGKGCDRTVPGRSARSR